MSLRPPGLCGPYPAQWSDPAMAAAYPARPPYEPETIHQLLSLYDGISPILDLGAGTGDLALPLASSGAEVVALEPSAAMTAVGRQRSGSDRIRWLQGRVEEVELGGPYGLAVAGESIHWMDLDQALPRIGQALAPDGFLALAYRRDRLRGGFGEPLQALITRCSTNTDYAPYDPFAMVGASTWFEPVGDWLAEPTERVVPVAHFVRSLHSRNGLGPGHLDPETLGIFDEQATKLLIERFGDEGVVITTANRVSWGRVRSQR